MSLVAMGFGMGCHPERKTRARLFTGLGIKIAMLRGLGAGLDFDCKENSWIEIPSPNHWILLLCEKNNFTKWSSKVIKHEKYYFPVSIHNCQSTWKLADIDLLPLRIREVVQALMTDLPIPLLTGHLLTSRHLFFAPIHFSILFFRHLYFLVFPTKSRKNLCSFYSVLILSRKKMVNFEK